ncbi:MBL fold metallo-hydrolase [Candidatus Uhrbacteria bacterium]|nr:MBL fold metallo-hydrolase [Candidatus Uhrbacteria bacterium]
MTKIIVLGSSAAFPLPRTVTNRFDDYSFITTYQKKFALHDDAVCHAAKHGGKNHRTRSCIALLHGRTTILFDAGPDIVYQLKRQNIRRPRAVFITHDHLDACAGLDQVPSSIAVYSEKRKTFTPGTVSLIRDIEILPFRVVHSKTAPAVGFCVSVPRKGKRPFRFVYATDMASLKGAKQYFQKADIVFADGSILRRNLPGHASITRQLRWYKQWRLKKVIFTHIGHRTLPHEELRRYLQRAYPCTDVAYDGMKIAIR